MINFAEVLTNNQAKNINKSSDEIGKNSETFNNGLTTYNKAKSSTGVAAIRINSNKTKAKGAATISVNPRNNPKANATVEDDVVAAVRTVSKKPLAWERVKGNANFNTNKKVVREGGESHPLKEDELSLYGGSDLDEQIDPLVNTTKSPKVNVASNNDDSEPEDEDDLIKDFANDFSAVEKLGPPIEKFG